MTSSTLLLPLVTAGVLLLQAVLAAVAGGSATVIEEEPGRSINSKVNLQHQQQARDAED